MGKRHLNKCYLDKCYSDESDEAEGVGDAQ